MCRSRSIRRPARPSQRHLDRRRHRSEAAEISAPHSRPGRKVRGRRRADGARLRRQGAAQGRSQRGLYAAHVRRPGARNLERRRSRQSDPHHAPSSWASRTRTRAGGNATPASPTSCRASPGWRTRRMTEIYDLSDPANPVKIRDFGLPGQQPGATGAVPTELHGPISLARKATASISATAPTRAASLQIVDRDKLLNGPKEPTADNSAAIRKSARLDMSAVQRRAHHLPDAGRCRSRNSPRTRTARRATSS